MGILTPDMIRIVRQQRLGYVATVCADGTPNLSPKGTTTVWDDDHLVFADICSPGTAANLERNPAIEVNVVDPIARRGYRFNGRAMIFTDGPSSRPDWTSTGACRRSTTGSSRASGRSSSSRSSGRHP